jgi:hypothetical protein
MNYSGQASGYDLPGCLRTRYATANNMYWFCHRLGLGQGGPIGKLQIVGFSGWYRRSCSLQLIG